MKSSNAAPFIAYIDLPCERCGSKKYISKTWTQTVKTSFGTTKLENSQIDCSNKKCQKEFAVNRKIEIQKVADRKLAKEESDKKRKEMVASAIAKRNMLKKITSNA